MRHGIHIGRRRTAAFALLVGSLLLLWIANGASGAPGDATASQVADIKNPGESLPGNLFNAGGTLLFAADDGVSGTELWKSNGGPLGPGGTEMVAEISPGSGAAGSSNPGGFTSINGTVFFAASDGIGPGDHGTELWKIDPPYTTPVMVEDINPTPPAGGNAGNSSPEHLTNVNGTLFFAASDGGDNVELWKSESPFIESTTQKVGEIAAGATGSYPDELTNGNGTLLFTADDGNGYELWKSSGGTPTMVENINPGTGVGSDPLDLTNLNGNLFFSADDGAAGRELWVSGGAFDQASTGIVDDINTAGSADSNPAWLTSVNGTLFFQATDGVTGQELWVLPPPYTSPGLRDINSNTGSTPDFLVNVGGTLFFSATGTTGGDELWKSNGGAVDAGTNLVKDINPTGTGSPDNLTGAGGQVFFRASDGIGPSDHGRELWKSDGTASGTVMVADINPGDDNLDLVPDSSDPELFTDVNSTLFFRANNGVTGRELWKATIEPAPVPQPPAPPPPPATAAPSQDFDPEAAIKKCKKKHKGKAKAKKRKKCIKKARQKAQA